MTRRYPPIARALMISAAFALPLAGVLPAVSVHAQQTDDLAAVNRAIRAISTLSANFTQTDPNGQVQSGKLLLKQPGQIRFDYGRGGDMLIVADGRSLYMIDYQVSQVQRWPIRNSPLGALLDPARDLGKYGRLAPTGDPRVVSVEVRDPAHPEYGVISLILTRTAGAPAGLELYGWVAKDAQGNRTSIRLTNMRYGAAIADSAFKWRDPRPNRVGPR